MFIMRAILAAAVASPSSGAITDPGSATTVRDIGQSMVGGAWTGKLLQKDWIFEFSNEDGVLRGRCKPSDGVNWQPLDEIVASGRSVSFSLKSKPKISFSLEIGASARNMSGTATIDGVAAVPFSASRSS